MKLPDFVTERLQQIAERLETDLTAIQKEYEEYFNDDFIQKDPQFTSDEQRHKYASGAFKARYMNRPKAVPMNIVPVGVDSIRKNKDGDATTSLFALDKSGKLRRISMKGNICFRVKQLNFFWMYKNVNLSEYKDGDLGADDRAKFDDPEQIDPFDLVEMLGIEKVEIPKVHKHLSKIDAAGYPIKSDWKCIRGFVGYTTQTSFDDGDKGEWGKIIVSDGDSDEAIITPSGEVISPGFNCWTAPTLQNYPRYSECYFLGPIVKGKRKNKDGSEEVTYSMNCYCIIPIIVTRAE